MDSFVEQVGSPDAEAVEAGELSEPTPRIPVCSDSADVPPSSRPIRSKLVAGG